MRKLSPGTWIERQMFTSEAFLSLRGAAPQLLILFLGKRQFQKIGRKGHEQRICTNCDSLIMTYAEAQKIGITKTRFLRGIDDLLAKGFLEVKHQGGAWKRDASRYGLSDFWKEWKPGDVFWRRAREIVPRGFCRKAGKIKAEQGGERSRN